MDQLKAFILYSVVASREKNNIHTHLRKNSQITASCYFGRPKIFRRALCILVNLNTCCKSFGIWEWFWNAYVYLYRKYVMVWHHFEHEMTLSKTIFFPFLCCSPSVHDPSWALIMNQWIFFSFWEQNNPNCRQTQNEMNLIEIKHGTTTNWIRIWNTKNKNITWYPHIYIYLRNIQR